LQGAEIALDEVKEEGEVCGALGRSRTCHLSTKGSYPAGVLVGIGVRVGQRQTRRF